MIDCLNRLISDHFSVLSSDETIIQQILIYLITIIDHCECYNYATLINESINEMFSKNDIPTSIIQLVPNVLQVLVKRSLLPTECYEAGSIDQYEDKDALLKFRSSCQDVLLEIASSSIGPFQTSTVLFDISYKNPSDLRVQESVLCLFCGIIDSIEGQLLPLFSPTEEDLKDVTDTHSSKRTDISYTPLITDYDEILNYVFLHMQEFTVHPLLLSTALQVMFSFDNWTFSRREHCQSLFQYLLISIPQSPVTLIPRLLCYISRLYESPCFEVTKEVVEQVLRLTPHIHSLNNEEILLLFVKTVSSSISNLSPKEAISMYQEFLHSYMEPIMHVGSNDHSSIHTSLKCLIAVFDGCLSDTLANALAEPVLSSLKNLFSTMFDEVNKQQNVVVIHSICGVCTSILNASDCCLSNENSLVILEIAHQLLHHSLLVQNALEIIDTLLSNVYSIVSREQIASLLTTINSLLLWNLENHCIKQTLDSTKLIIRIQLIILKESSADLMNQENLVLTIVGMVVKVIQEMVNEEELIRLILRFVSFILQVWFDDCLMIVEVFVFIRAYLWRLNCCLFSIISDECVIPITFTDCESA